MGRRLKENDAINLCAARPFRWRTVLMTVGTFVLILSGGLTASDIALAASAKVGETFKDCKKCPKMVVIPGGKFLMGDDKGKKNQRPAHEVTIKGPLAISIYEVTWIEWQACKKAGACKRDLDSHKWGKGKRPVINMSWNETQDYTKWLAKKTGRPYRLLSEAEWEYAARAGSTTAYWWGDKLKKKYANCRKCGTKWSGKKSAPVGSFKPNQWGIYDMHANIWEWTLDCHNKTHAFAPKNQTPRTDGNCDRRTVRGGSWYYFPQIAKSVSRDSHPQHLWSYNIGIRLGLPLY